MVFKPTKPDARVLIIQIIVAGILSFHFQNHWVVFCFFLAIDFVILFWYGMKNFAKRLLVYVTLNIVAVGLLKMELPVVSSVFLPFIMLVVRMYPVYLLLKLLVDKMPMDELLYSLEVIHIPKPLSIPLMVVYRYIPTIMQEVRYVNENLKMRGMNFSLSNIRFLVRTVENYMVPLLFRSEKIAEELSATSLCKGLSTRRKRSCCTDVKMEACDYCYLLGILIVIGGLFYLEFLDL